MFNSHTVFQYLSTDIMQLWEDDIVAFWRLVVLWYLSVLRTEDLRQNTVGTPVPSNRLRASKNLNSNIFINFFLIHHIINEISVSEIIAFQKRGEAPNFGCSLTGACLVRDTDLAAPESQDLLHGGHPPMGGAGIYTLYSCKYKFRYNMNIHELLKLGKYKCSEILTKWSQYP